MVPSWFKPFAYGVYAINSLILLLAAVDYLLCEVDLFGIVWMSSTLLLVTVPIGVIFFIYSLFHLRHKEERCIAIWTAAMVLFFFVVFWLLPSGSSRVPAKMEKHCVKHESDMLSIATSLYDLMPDSTMLEYTPKDGITLCRIQSSSNFFNYPIPDTEDTIDASTYSQFPILNSQLLKTLHCSKLTIYKPTAVALFDYLTIGFATYWFEVLVIPNTYTDEGIQWQFDTPNTIPYSYHTCFCYYGGATDGDSPFPYKEKYVERRSM